MPRLTRELSFPQVCASPWRWPRRSPAKHSNTCATSKFTTRTRWPGGIPRLRCLTTAWKAAIPDRRPTSAPLITSRIASRRRGCRPRARTAAISRPFRCTRSTSSLRARASRSSAPMARQTALKFLEQITIAAADNLAAQTRSAADVSRLLRQGGHGRHRRQNRRLLRHAARRAAQRLGTRGQCPRGRRPRDHQRR